MSLRIALATLLASGAAQAAESVQPYIDLLKQGLEPETHPAPKPQAGEPDPYLQGIRRNLEKTAPPSSGQSYIEELKSQDPSLRQAPDEPGYAEREKAKLEPKKKDGAIEAVLAGKSELKPVKEGAIRQTAGFKFNSYSSRTITASPGTGTGRRFSDIYGRGYAPELTLFYDYQLWRSEGFGSLALATSLGVSYHTGNGVFEVALVNPVTGAQFPGTALSKFKFFTIPIFLGGKFTLAVGKYLQPYAYAGPTMIGYYEMRSDRPQTSRGRTFGVQGGAGVNILLDFLTPKTSWELYGDYKIHHYYLTLDYSKTVARSGGVQFDTSLINLGLTYEF